MNIRLAKIQEINDIVSIDADANITCWNKEEYLESFYNKSQSIYVLELSNNEIIGLLVVSLALDEAEILQMCIKRSYHRRGYGKILLHRVIDILHLVHHVSRVFLEVRDSNTPAIHLYQSCGFKQIGRRHNYYKVDNWRFDAILMVFECNNLSI